MSIGHEIAMGEQMIDARDYVVSVPIRWSDQDINGHVNNAKVVTIVEEARIQWLNKDAAAEGIYSFDTPKVVVSLNVEFRQPLSASADVNVGISVTQIGRSSFTLAYRGTQGGDHKFTAATKLVVLDSSTNVPRPIDENERSYLMRHSPSTLMAVEA